MSGPRLAVRIAIPLEHLALAEGFSGQSITRVRAAKRSKPPRPRNWRRRHPRLCHHAAVTHLLCVVLAVPARLDENSKSGFPCGLGGYSRSATRATMFCLANTERLRITENPLPPRSSANQRGPRTPDPHRVGAGWGWWTARRRASIRPTTPVMSAPRGLACAVTPPSVSRNMHRANSSEPCHESYFDFPSSPQSGFGPLLPPTGCWSKAARGCRATLALYPWVPSVYGAPFLLAITPFSPGIFTFAVLFWSLRVVSLVSYRPL